MNIRLLLQRHWLSLVLLGILVIVVLNPRVSQPSFQSFAPSAGVGVAMDMTSEAGMAYQERSSILPPESPAPPVDNPNRLVIKDTSLSMVVNDVTETVTRIEDIAQTHGGFLVASNVTTPEGASSGVITIRVPNEQRDTVLQAVQALGVRVVSQRVNGRDVTDEYVDIQSRLDVLEQTKVKFEELMDAAVEISDLLQIQRELINLQAQIDSLKGQAQFLEGSASLSKITINLSTDELALPYAPDQPWRPAAVFKQAVRSLVSTLRDGVDALIWIGVYAVIWVPILLAILLLKYALTKRS